MNTITSQAVKRVFIFEPCLGSMTGHWESNTRRFRDEFVQRGIEVIVFCQKNPSPEILEQYNAIPVFTTHPFNPVTDKDSFEREYQQFKNDYNNIDKSLFKKGDLLLFNTIVPHTHKAVMEWLGAIVRPDGPKAVFIFMIAANDFHVNLDSWKYRLQAKLTRYKYFRKKFLRRLYLWPDCDYIQFYKSYAHLFNSKNESAGYYYFSGCEEFAMNFEDILDTRVRTLPFPTITHHAMGTNTIPRLDNDIVRVGYFGHSSLEKGAQFLEYVVTRTLKECKNVQFDLHINPNIHSKEILTKFAETPRENVNFFLGHRSYEELVGLMRAVDINLLPYSQLKYAGVPSMVFTEAVNAGNVVVVPNYTWLSREAEKIKGGYTLFDFYNQESIAEAVITAVKKIKRLKRKVPCGRERFLLEHNIKRYMDIIVDTVSGCREDI